MSAIAGIIRPDRQPVDRATVERMQAVLTPYGRDAQKSWRKDAAALLCTTLRTTPEDSLDNQPLMEPFTGTVFVFDGRLDNRDELAHSLGLPPSETILMADSALALRACLHWDVQAVDHMSGVFALACWQPARRRLWLARDPLGYRPLYWHKQADFFAFATMPKALFAVPGVPRAICEERLCDYICLLPTVGPESLFKDIYRVEPGHWLVFEDNRVVTRRYHHLDPEREIHLASDDEYLEAFRDHLERAVACRLRSNGPVGSLLSSGYDSSTVTAIAARLLGARGKSLLAYTSVPRDGFAGPVPKGAHADEGPGACALAARFPNIEHILIRTDCASPLDNLRENTENIDRPPLNPCNMAWVNGIRDDAARRGVRVLLTGAMGNMSISYTGDQYLPALIRKGEWFTWWREVRALRQRNRERRLHGLLALSFGPYLPAMLWIAIAKYRNRGLKLTDYTAIHPDFLARMEGLRRARTAGWDLSYRPWADGRRMRIAAINRLDIGDYYAADNTAGLDTRDPLNDLRLIEFCLSVPDRQYLHNGQTRRLLHRLMDDVLPPEILNSPTKGLQAADWYEVSKRALPGMREELKCMIVHGGVGDYLDLNGLLRSLEAWPDSGFETAGIIHAYRLKLLRGLSVGTFIRYVENNNR